MPPDQWQALELDLLDRNRSLDDIGTERLNWRLLLTLIKYSSRTSALARATFGDEVVWSATDYLLANLVDLTNLLLWFKTADGQKNKNRPKALPRPGMVEPVSDGVKIGGKGVPREEFADRWAEAVARQLAEEKEKEGT